MRPGALAANAITGAGLLVGLVAVGAGAAGDVGLLMHLLLLVFGLDALDGYVARRFDGVTRFGRFADSISDFVAFGAGGALLAFRLVPDPVLGVAAGLFWAACAGWRLWRFARATEDRGAFKGLPSSAATLGLFALLILNWPVVGGAVVLALGGLMISPVRFTRALTTIAACAVAGAALALALLGISSGTLPLAAGVAALAYTVTGMMTGLRRRRSTM